MSLPSITIQISASAVAWYAAIVATISLSFTGLSYWRDRARVQIKLSQGFLAYAPNNVGGIKIFIEAINHGRRSVTLDGAGLSLRNGKKLAVTRPETINFPHELQEGKAVQVSLDKNEVFQAAAQEQSEITHAWYRDATGKIYKTSFTIRNK